MKKSQLRHIIREVISEQGQNIDMHPEAIAPTIRYETVAGNIDGETVYNTEVAFMFVYCPSGYYMKDDFTTVYTSGYMGDPFPGEGIKGHIMRQCIPIDIGDRPGVDVLKPTKPELQSPANPAKDPSQLNPGTKDPVRGVDTGTSGPFQVDN